VGEYDSAVERGKEERASRQRGGGGENSFLLGQVKHSVFAPFPNSQTTQSSISVLVSKS
jgi:hypothetical protein